MPDVPAPALAAAEAAISDELQSSREIEPDALARAALEAAAPILAEAWGVKPKRVRSPRPAERVACPRCGAGSGEDCRSANSYPVGPHRARVAAARKSGLNPEVPGD